MQSLRRIKKHCINPVDSRETGLEKPQTLVQTFPEPEDVKIFDGFSAMPEAELKELYDSLGLAMTFKDFLHIQNYFKNEEKARPRPIDGRSAYWTPTGPITAVIRRFPQSLRT